MAKSGHEHQEDSIRFFRLEEELEEAKNRIADLEATIGKLAPLIKWITPEREVVIETKHVPIKCEKWFDPVKGRTECRPIKELNGIA